MSLMIDVLRRFASNQALAIVDLLVNDPNGWKRCQYRLIHEGAQIQIWVANQVYGLKLEQMNICDQLYKKMPYVDRKLIWIHTTPFKWTDPNPAKIVGRIADAQVSKKDRQHVEP